MNKKFTFIGTTDHNFVYGCTYTVLEMNVTESYLYVFIINKYHNLVCIPYINLDNFNANWIPEED